MTVSELRCRVVGTREAGASLWTFHLVNDGDAPIESAELTDVKYEWGDEYVGGEAPGVRVGPIEPGQHALLWRDDGGSEMRTDLWLRVRHGGRELWLLFEFPRLYRQTGTRLEAAPEEMSGPPGR